MHSGVDGRAVPRAGMGRRKRGGNASSGLAVILLLTDMKMDKDQVLKVPSA